MESGRRKVVTTFKGDPGYTQKHFADEINVNRIVQRFRETGELPRARQAASYGIAPSQTFTEAMFTLKEAEREFMSLPSAVRAHFDNKVEEYMDAASDPSRTDEFIELGLMIGPEENAPEEPSEAPEPEPTPE